MEISRHVWEGNDYLPSVFESWLNDENSHFHCVEADGRVVAVANLRLLEGGRTGWMEGLRVHPDYRGKGYANEMTHFLVRKAEDLGVERLRYTTGDNNAASLRLASMAGFQRLLEKSVFWCVKPKKAPTVRGYLPIEEAKPERAFELLKTNPSLVLHGVLVYDWKAVDSTPGNFEEIGRDHGFFVALKNGKLDSMSFGHCRQDLEKTWGFTVYASDSEGFSGSTLIQYGKSAGGWSRPGHGHLRKRVRRDVAASRFRMRGARFRPSCSARKTGQASELTPAERSQLHSAIYEKRQEFQKETRCENYDYIDVEKYLR